MADGQRVSKPKRLHEGREHLIPGAVVPKREFDGFEMRAIGKACRIPGEGLGAVIVGVELIDALARSGARAGFLTSAARRGASVFKMRVASQVDGRAASLRTRRRSVPGSCRGRAAEIGPSRMMSLSVANNGIGTPAGVFAQAKVGLGTSIVKGARPPTRYPG